MKKFELPEKPLKYQNLINGAWVDAADGKTYTRESPAHGSIIGEYPLSSSRDTEDAIKAARSAFQKETWTLMPGVERAKIINRAAAGIRERAEELALIETLESGKPISQALDEMEWAAGIWDYAATLCRHQYGDANNNLGSDMLAFMYRQPIGVVGMITPWNFPLLIISQKLPFALAAGCTAVVKPSELTPGTTLKLGEILQEAGIPDGAVNILAGFGDPVGKTLSESMYVDMISFTGSTMVGKQIVAASQHNLKKVSLELGGKNPQIIFPDADMDAVVDSVVFGVYFNMGECCNSGSRLLIHEDVADDFLQKVLDHACKVKVGDPLDPEVKVGAIINDKQLDKILEYIESGKKQGAELKLGGELMKSSKGVYFQPTVFSEVRPDMDIAKEEIFGPVLSIIRFRDTEEAVKIANSTIYGLSASIWTRDLDTALIMSRKIEAGTVWVNNFMTGYPEVSFGGFRQSGLGRELGRFSVEEFSELKSVLIHTGPPGGPWVNPDAPSECD
ncbi:aldehyde dehydrogenase family protein [Bacteroidota bacterium]